MKIVTSLGESPTGDADQSGSADVNFGSICFRPYPGTCISLSGYRDRERELDGGGGRKSVKYEVGTSKRFRRDNYVRVVLLCENADSGSAKR